LGHPAAGPAFTSLTLWQAVDAYRAVPPRAPVAAETALRLGQNYVRLARPDLALPEFMRAETLATTPHEQYLARLFAGAAFARAGRQTEAMTAFEGALHAVPRASSASFALARLLLDQEKWEEAAAILEAAMTMPQPDDPLDYYYWSDPAATSRALMQLREKAQQ
jgi:tetratricopeptide (TPR) repeat protein